MCQHVNAILSIGGWTGSQYFSSAVATEANRTAFAQTVMKTVSKYNLDGVEFECARFLSLSPTRSLPDPQLGVSRSAVDRLQPRIQFGHCQLPFFPANPPQTERGKKYPHFRRCLDNSIRWFGWQTLIRRLGVREGPRLHWFVPVSPFVILTAVF